MSSGNRTLWEPFCPLSTVRHSGMRIRPGLQRGSPPCARDGREAATERRAQRGV